MLCPPSSGPLPVATVGALAPALAGFQPVCVYPLFQTDIGYMAHMPGTHFSGIILRLLVCDLGLYGLVFFISGLVPFISLHIAKCFECELDHLCRLTFKPNKKGHFTSHFFFSLLNAGSPTQSPY